MKQYFSTLPISQLVDHPENAKLFGKKLDEELTKSIEANGIITPIIVAQLTSNSFRIVSGHRRKQSAESLGIDKVPCNVRQELTPLEVDELWAESNVQREMTNEQKARWYEIRKRIEEMKARDRQKIAGGDKKSGKAKSLRDNCPTAISSNKNRARDVAAAEVGWSGKKADKAVEVVKEIDKAEESGDIKKAEELRETLENQSVNAAAEKVKQYKDTFDVAEIEGKKPRKKQSVEKNPAPIANALITKHCSPLARGIDEVAEVLGWKKGTRRDGHNAEANDSLNSLIDALKQMAKGKL